MTNQNDENQNRVILDLLISIRDEIRALREDLRTRERVIPSSPLLQKTGEGPKFVSYVDLAVRVGEIKAKFETHLQREHRH